MRKTNFHMNGFALELVLKKRRRELENGLSTQVRLPHSRYSTFVVGKKKNQDWGCCKLRTVTLRRHLGMLLDAECRLNIPWKKRLVQLQPTFQCFQKQAAYNSLFNYFKSTPLVSLLRMQRRSLGSSDTPSPQRSFVGRSAT